MITLAQTNYHFAHTELASATPDVIWQIWVDVPNWNRWDSGLKSAELAGDFKLGAKGTLIPDKGPRSKFIISEYNEGVSYTFKTRIPFGWLIVKRYLDSSPKQTAFTHEIRFTGLLKKPLGNRLGKRYREMLPEVMQKINAIAEDREQTL